MDVNDSKQTEFLCRPNRAITASITVRLLQVNIRAKDPLREDSVVGYKAEINFKKIWVVCGIQMTS